MKLTHMGLQKTTLIDYPGKVAAVIFTPGCNLRCPYCHNPDLVQNIDRSSLIPKEEIESFLKRRSSVLGGVVISGGEPLMFRDDLIELIKYIHSLGMKVKLDTNGTFPRELLSMDVDYIAMDLKTSPKKYPLLGYNIKNTEKILKESLQYIKTCGIDHQIRCTVVDELIDESDVYEMANLLQGIKQLRLTPFRPGNTLDPMYGQKKSPSAAMMQTLKDLFISKGIPTIVE